MNKLIIALSLACASAYVFAAGETAVGATPKPGTKTAWFSATAGETPSGGSFNKNPDTIVVADVTKYVIDSEIGSPVTFTSTDSLGKDMASVTFQLDTAIVPADVRTSTALSDTAKVAFAASEVNDTTKGYFAWLGSEWVQLTGATPGEDGTSYKLVVTFDNRADSKKVQFKVGDTVLTSEGQEWIPYGTALLGTMSIDLVGSGNVTSFAGSQIEIASEIIVVDGGTIDIREEDMAAFKKAKPDTYDTVDAFVAAPASEAFGSDKFKTTGITVGAAYALGLVVKDKNNKMVPKDGGQLIAKAVADANLDGIKLELNVAPPENTGATIVYKFFEGETDITTDVKDSVIPKSKFGAGLRKFTVKAIVTPAAK